MIYVAVAGILFVICAPFWAIAISLIHLGNSFDAVYKVKEKIVAQEKKSVAPTIMPEMDINKINEQLDTALALRRESEDVESHLSGLGKEVHVEAEDRTDAVLKLKNLGKQ